MDEHLILSTNLVWQASGLAFHKFSARWGHRQGHRQRSWVVCFGVWEARYPRKLYTNGEPQIVCPNLSWEQFGSNSRTFVVKFQSSSCKKNHLVMTKKQWTTPKQRAWLEALVPKFVEAQRDSTTTTEFFPTTYQSWFENFPDRKPTEAELKDTGLANIADATLKVEAEIRQFQTKVCI